MYVGPGYADFKSRSSMLKNKRAFSVSRMRADEMLLALTVEEIAP